MTLTRIPGKDAALEESITRLQGQLKKLGFDIEEVSWRNPAPYCWSVHIHDRHCPLLFTNGKGSSRMAALASALGEFFERLSTRYFFADYYYGKIDRNTPAHHPDERWFPIPDDDTWPQQLLADPALRSFYDPEGELPASSLVDLNTGNSARGICTLPFTRQRDKTPVWFPVNIIGNLYVSNGMSAGNTRDEARVQALAEIFERAIKFRIIAEGIALPDIPAIVLARYPHIEASIAALRQAGYGILLKDASLGGKYPVINVTLLNREDGSCFASFGAHPQFEVALERTVTELLQGRDLDSLHGFSEPSFDRIEVASPLNLETHFIDSSGLIAWDFFKSTPDHAFSDWNFSGTTAEEYAFLCNILHEEGYEIYCRDMNHLGVDTCRIIVPGFSEIYPVEDLQWDNNNAAITLRDRILNISTLPAEALFLLAQELEEHGFDQQQPVAALIGLAPDSDGTWETLRVGELELLLAIRQQDWATAIDQLQWVLQYGQADTTTLNRYRCLLNLLSLRRDQGQQAGQYRAALQALHGADILRQCEGMLQGRGIFDHLPPPGDHMENTITHRKLLEALQLTRKPQ